VTELFGTPSVEFSTHTQLQSSDLEAMSFAFTSITNDSVSGLPASALPEIRGRALWFEYSPTAGHLVYQTNRTPSNSSCGLAPDSRSAPVDISRAHCAGGRTRDTSPDSVADVARGSDEFAKSMIVASLDSGGGAHRAMMTANVSVT